MKKVTLETIAGRLGITKVTVSKALKNQPGVSEALKERILQVANELGYMNRKERGSEEGVKLGFLVAKRFFLDTDNFYTQIYYYLSRECASHNINLSLYILNPEEEDNEALPFTFVQDLGSLKGLFVAGEVSVRYMKQALLRLNLPTVAIDFYQLDLEVDSIVTDNYLSGFLVTQHLIEAGHRDIGFVGDPHYTNSVMDRFCGYTKALIQNDLPFNKQWHLVNNDSKGMYNIDFALPETLPTAFVCHCDMAAYKLQLKLQSQGIAVPEQVSLISFDNTELSHNMSPNLTSLDISKMNMSTKALNRMLRRMKHPNEEPQKVTVNIRLVVRDSVRKLSEVARV